MAILIGCNNNDDKDKDSSLGNIYGIVTDYTNANAPIAGATVTLNTKGLTKTTGSDGRFEFTNVERGTYTVQVMANNYQTTTKQVTVYAGKNSICDFQLSKSSANVEISTATLSYAKEISQMSFTIKNNSNNQYNYSITNIPDYLTLSSTSGLVQAKGNQVIVVTVNNRSAITSNRNSQMIVTIGSESFVVNVFIEGTNASDGGDESDNSGGGSTVSDVTRGLLAYYNFDDGTANNAKGGTNNGTIQGTTSSYITDTPNGKGQALSLGSKNYVRIPQNMLYAINAFSISMWVKDFGTGALFISTFTDDVFNGAPRLYVNGSNTFMADGCAEIFDSAKSMGVSATNYQSSGWHMVTATFGNRKINLYIDGVLVSSTTHYNATEGYGNMMAIGGKASDWWSSSMKVDNVRVYDVMLTDAEVKNIYNFEK